MKLYQLYVPITNYEGNGIFEQEMFILAPTCPRIFNWIEFAEEKHNRDKEYPEYTGTWQEVIETLLKVEKSELYLAGNCVQTSTFVETKFGKQSICIRQPYVKELI